MTKEDSRISKLSFAVLFGILFLVIVIGTFVGRSVSLSAPTTSALATYKEVVVVPSVDIGDVSIPVEVATTSTAVQKGLSGRTSLDAGHGMLFIFKNPDRYRFWMPDMHFRIDMIWISATGTVVDIDHNVTNKFDPAHPVFYTPASPVRYVLEVNAGLAKQQGIEVGDHAALKNIDE